MFSENALVRALVSEQPSNGVPNSRTAERELLVAILQRAFLDYFGNQTLYKTNATEWMFEGEDEPETEEQDSQFTFHWICQHLDIDPSNLRKQLRKITAEETDLHHKYFQMRRRA